MRVTCPILDFFCVYIYDYVERHLEKPSAICRPAARYDLRIRACCFRWAKNGGAVLQGVADADSAERQNFADSEKICIFAIRKPIIMKRYDIPELIPRWSGGTHALASSCTAAIADSLVAHGDHLGNGNYNGDLMMNYHSPSEIIPRRKREVNLFNNARY